MTRLEAEKQLWSLQKTLLQLKLGIISNPDWGAEQLEQIIDALIIASDDLHEKRILEND